MNYYQTLIIFSIFSLSSCMHEESSTKQSKVVTELEGTWARDCFEDNIAGISGFSLWTEHYTNNTYEAEYSLFDNPDCNGSFIVQKKIIGSFSIGQPLITHAGLKAVAIDVSTHETQVLGIDNESEFETPSFEEGKSFYDIYYKDGDNIYYGFTDADEEDGSSPDTRPNEIDLSIKFTKIN